MILNATEAKRQAVWRRSTCWQNLALASLALLTLSGCSHHRKKCDPEATCVNYPATGTAGYYNTCWSEWQEGPVGCVPSWIPVETKPEEIIAPPPVGGFAPLDDETPEAPVMEEEGEEIEEGKELEEGEEPKDSTETSREAWTPHRVGGFSAYQDNANLGTYAVETSSQDSPVHHRVGGFSTPETSFGRLERLPR